MEHSTPQIYTEFLPISRADMEARGWEQLDFVVVGGDAYVDHPSFGTAIISRLLEAEGYKVGVLAQPRYTDCEDFKRFGKPKYGFFIGGGNVDSMVSHYSVAKIPRAEDEYSPGGKAGARPDRSATVYTKLAKQAYPDLPVILGGLEASLRRFAHYDYWLDTVLPSIAEDSGADLISFGMGEHQTVEIARRLAAGESVETITDVNGTCSSPSLPSRMVRMRSACCAISNSCVIMTMVTPVLCSSWNSSITCSPEAVSKAPVGSSASSNFGWLIIARAMATRCFCPPESCVGRKETRSARPTFSSASLARSRRTFGFTPA